MKDQSFNQFLALGFLIHAYNSEGWWVMSGFVLFMMYSFIALYCNLKA